MITNKIKSLLALKGFNFSDFARTLNVTRQSLNNKSKVDAYKIQDLINLGNLTNTQLAFIDKDTKETIITFSIEDIKKDTNQ